MNVFIRAIVRVFSFGERWSVPINSPSSHKNILTIALINIYYLYNSANMINVHTLDTDSLLSSFQILGKIVFWVKQAFTLCFFHVLRESGRIS